MSAGYSGTPLPKKLGIKADAKVLLVEAPEGFEATLEPLPAGANLVRRAHGGPFDVIVLFVERFADLRRRLPSLVRHLVPNGGLWVGYPKKSSGVATDLRFEEVQGEGLALGLVDNKICAIDEVWTGLRFVIRLKDRPKT
jgi:hypothetical protein